MGGRHCLGERFVAAYRPVAGTRADVAESFDNNSFRTAAQISKNAQKRVGEERRVTAARILSAGDDDLLRIIPAVRIRCPPRWKTRNGKRFGPLHGGNRWRQLPA
jgi:hypothetical protein